MRLEPAKWFHLLNTPRFGFSPPECHGNRPPRFYLVHALKLPTCAKASYTCAKASYVLNYFPLECAWTCPMCFFARAPFKALSHSVGSDWNTPGPAQGFDLPYACHAWGLNLCSSPPECGLATHARWGMLNESFSRSLPSHVYRETGVDTWSPPFLLHCFL